MGGIGKFITGPNGSSKVTHPVSSLGNGESDGKLVNKKRRVSLKTIENRALFVSTKAVFATYLRQWTRSGAKRAGEMPEWVSIKPLSLA